LRMSIVVVYGIPGSGKSTLCERLQSIDRSMIVWSFDETTVVEGETEKDWRRRAQEQSITGINDRPQTVHLLDDVFYLQSMRRPFERLSRFIGVEYGTIFVEESAEAAIAKDKKRPVNRRVDGECIRRIEERMERSTVGEEMVYRSTDDLPRIGQWLSELRIRGMEKRRRREEGRERKELRSLSSPLEPLSCQQREMDLQLRRIITELCRGGADGRILSTVKRTILEDMRREGRRMEEMEMRTRIDEELRKNRYGTQQ
ncbi:hypothetical protein PENTCL1PPCAC_11650, partial [Pristionchus entomophagus]